MSSILWERDYWRALAEVLAAALQDAVADLEKARTDYDDLVDAFHSHTNRLHAKLDAALREVRDG